MRNTLCVLCLICLALVSPLNASERELRGRLSLGDHLDLVMEIREGFIKEGFRWLGLLSKPRPRVNLTKLGLKGDRLFFSSDGKLYCRRKAEGTQEATIYRVSANLTLLDIRLEPSVRLLEMSSRGLDFGAGKVALKVKVPAKLRIGEDKGVRKANYYYWLDELAYAYDENDGSKRSRNQAYERLERSMRNVLPMRDDDAQHRIENLKLLRKYVNAEDPEKLPSILPLVEGKILEVQDRMKRNAADAAFYEPVLKMYQILAVQLREKTYDM